MKSGQKKISSDELKHNANSGGNLYIASKSEEDRLRKAVYASDMEKLHLFTQMLRANALFKRAGITHKK